MSALARRMSPAAPPLCLSSNKAISGQPIEVGFHSGAPYAMQESKRLHPLSRAWDRERQRPCSWRGTRFPPPRNSAEPLAGLFTSVAMPRAFLWGV